MAQFFFDSVYNAKKMTMWGGLNFGLIWYIFGNYLMRIQRMSNVLVREVRRGRGETVLSRDKTEVGWEEVVNAGRWVTNVLKE